MNAPLGKQQQWELRQPARLAALALRQAMALSAIASTPYPTMAAQIAALREVQVSLAIALAEQEAGEALTRFDCNGVSMLATYDVQPFEPATHDYPGCPSELTITFLTIEGATDDLSEIYAEAGKTEELHDALAAQLEKDHE